MKVLLLEPFFEGSHKQWAEGYQRHSEHQIEILSLPGLHWKWRMHGGAVSLAARFLESDIKPDVILATDMLDLATFQALTRTRTANIPCAVYFHENQLSYPWSPNDPDVAQGRDNHYGFINYTTALSADKVFFNSEYHRTSFLQALTELLRRFPDHSEIGNVELIEKKSKVLPLALDLKSLDVKEPVEKGELPLILWNHRWEYDKGPEEFFKVLFELSEEGIEFELAVLGEQYSRSPKIFDEAKERLSKHIVTWGFQKDRKEYVQWLHRADILPVTSIQDFFGISVIEAMYCSVHPILPDRLAYPEHFPESEMDKFFYKNKDELKSKLRSSISTIDKIRMSSIPSVELYDLSEMIRIYDAALTALTDKM